MNNAEPKLAADGERLLKDWILAAERLEHLRRQINQAECDVSNTTNALGKWMTPNGAKVGEVFNIWQGNGLLSVRLEDRSFRIEWRQRPTKGVGA